MEKKNGYNTQQPRTSTEKRNKGEREKPSQNYQTQKSGLPRSKFGHQVIECKLIRAIISQTQALTHRQSTSSPSEDPSRLMNRRKKRHQLVLIRKNYCTRGRHRGSRIYGNLKLPIHLRRWRSDHINI